MTSIRTVKQQCQATRQTGGVTYHEQQLFTFDEAVRSSSNVRLQAHNIE